MNLDILSEFLGTLVLIVLGNGVVFSVNHTRMFANQPGKWVVITLAWGLAVMFGVIVSMALNGSGHLNPAVTVFVWISDSDFAHSMHGFKPVLYIIAQITGAMVAQMLLDFMNWKHMQETDSASIRAAHCTNPAFENFGKDKAVAQNVAYELVGTLMLLGVILAFGKGLNVDNGDNAGTLAFLGPLPVTFLVMAIGMSLGASTGYAINPARDLGPRIVYFALSNLMLKKKREMVKANFAYGWVPVVAPLVAGVIIGCFALIK